ncbi:MAG: hypothetical protein KDD45_04945 [Bdellovibrionales bacterium]|nr:hypothetical protein [Bdellovibrionales bacterium]
MFRIQVFLFIFFVGLIVKSEVENFYDVQGMNLWDSKVETTIFFTPKGRLTSEQQVDGAGKIKTGYEQTVKSREVNKFRFFSPKRSDLVDVLVKKDKNGQFEFISTAKTLGQMEKYFTQIVFHDQKIIRMNYCRNNNLCFIVSDKICKNLKDDKKTYKKKKKKTE